MTLEELQSHRRAIIEIAGRYGASNVRVFGSVARGDAGGSSDVDILVAFAEGRDYFDQGGLVYELRALLKCDVDVVSESDLRGRGRDRILGEAIGL